MARHYFLPNINVTITAIPKTGITSLKNYLFVLEQELVRDGSADLAPIKYPGRGINGSSLMRDFLLKSIKDKRAEQSLRILILRNPYERVLSCWANKLLFAQQDYSIFERLRNESFTPVDFSSLEELDQAFEKFTEKLSLDELFLYSNNHWMPQVEFFSDIAEYDVVLETAELARLEGILSRHLGRQPGPHQLDFPRFNRTNSVLVPNIGSTRAWNFVEATYGKDLDAMSRAGLNVKRPDENGVVREPISDQAFEAEKIQILASRAFSESQRLREQIQDIKVSWSWRLTAWLRWISAPWLRRR